MTHDFWKSDFEILATKTQKPKFKVLIEPTALTSRLRENWLRQFSEFPAPKNWCPENSAQWSQLADKQKTINQGNKEKP